jgi:hypothetical protein
MPKTSRSYNNNQVYPMAGIAGKDKDGITAQQAIRPAMKKGPQPVDMGTTSARAQTAKFFKGCESEGH